MRIYYIHSLYILKYISIYVSIIKSRRKRWAGHVERMGEKRNVYRILVGKSEGKRPMGRPRRRWVDNIKMDLREIGWEGPVEGSCVHGIEPSGSIKCWDVLEGLHNWRLLKKGSAP
jgi:hypothetical protein